MKIVALLNIKAGGGSTFIYHGTLNGRRAGL
jgi:hypothetical protein